MRTVKYTWNDVEAAANTITAQLLRDEWKPDYIVGITRGGLPLAVMLSHRIKVPMYSLDVSLRDNSAMGPESNCWMSEDAFGYNYPEESGVTGARWDIKQRKKMLIVDDINDTGATFNWIKNDWQSSCLPVETSAWNSVWGGGKPNVRFAVMTENMSSKFDGVMYYANEVNKSEQDVWLVYPWEL